MPARPVLILCEPHQIVTVALAAVLRAYVSSLLTAAAVCAVSETYCGSPWLALRCGHALLAFTLLAAYPWTISCIDKCRSACWRKRQGQSDWQTHPNH